MCRTPTAANAATCSATSSRFPTAREAASGGGNETIIRLGSVLGVDAVVLTAPVAAFKQLVAPMPIRIREHSQMGSAQTTARPNDCMHPIQPAPVFPLSERIARPTVARSVSWVRTNRSNPEDEAAVVCCAVRSECSRWWRSARGLPRQETCCVCRVARSSVSRQDYSGRPGRRWRLFWPTRA